jgi:hypothetical protein
MSSVHLNSKGGTDFGCLSGIQKGKDNKKRKLSDQFQNPIRKSEKQTISILLARICIHVYRTPNKE